MQRNVSTPLQLHELNIVNKSSSDLHSSKDETTTTPPIPGPRLNIKTKVISPRRPPQQQTPQQTPQLNNEINNDDTLYTLATKKRQIVELEQQLIQLKKEVAILESGLQRDSNINNINNNNMTRPKFMQTILDKFNEFNVGEDEFDNQLQSRNNDEFYLKNGYDLGEDELEKEAREEMGFLQRLQQRRNIKR